MHNAEEVHQSACLISESFNQILTKFNVGNQHKSELNFISCCVQPLQPLLGVLLKLPDLENTAF
jgi:hypothetical protein